MKIIFDRAIYFICALMFFCIYAEKSVADGTQSIYSGIKSNARHGVVHMPGVILDAACEIATESRNQTIDLNLSSVESILRNGYGEIKTFSIKLLNCTRKRADGTTVWKNINISFVGDSDFNDNSLFQLHGTILGVGIQVLDDNHNVVSPGRRVVLNQVPEDSLELRYNVRLAADKANIESGIGDLTIQLRFDYE